MARVGFKSHHRTTPDGTVTGGASFGTGFTIAWQDGPLLQLEGSPEGHRLEPNGAFVEDVLGACLDRLCSFQSSPYACSENADAIRFLKAALEALERRTKDREARAVEGSHTP